MKTMFALGNIGFECSAILGGVWNDRRGCSPFKPNGHHVQHEYDSGRTTQAIERSTRPRRFVDRMVSAFSSGTLARVDENLAVLSQFYLRVGGSLDPEPDPQSPFDAFIPRGKAPAYGRAGVRACFTARPSLAGIATSSSLLMSKT